MFILIPIFILTCSICCLMASSGAYLVNTSKDPNRNITVDYMVYVSLAFGSISVLLLVLPPLLFGYSIMNFFGFV